MGNPLDSERGPEPKPPALAAGQVIAGKFRVERVVGEGGMGLVVEAVNLQLDQRVALKFLRQDIERSPALVERFAREARAAVKLRSEHVARVSDVGSHPAYGPFMVMELLDGSTLGDVLVAGGPLPCHRAVEYVIHACEGLAEAHARGIVHQDVKPANLFLATGNDGRPRVKVLDFGISKATLSGPLSEKDATTGRGGAHIGTPHYLSPEQLRAVKDVDHRADVWALGCVLFELVTREKAFRAGRFTELVARILEAPRESVPAGVDVPAGLVEVIDRCLQKDRTKRFANTAELALALLPFARRRAARSVAERAVAHVRDGGLDPHLTMPSSMPPPAPSDSSTDLFSSQNLRPPGVPDMKELTPEPAPAPVKRKVGILIVAGALAVSAIGAFVVVRGASARPEPSAGPVTSSSAVSSVAPPADSSAAPVVAVPTSPAPSIRAATSAAPPASASQATPRSVIPAAPRAPVRGSAGTFHGSPARAPGSAQNAPETDIRNAR